MKTEAQKRANVKWDKENMKVLSIKIRKEEVEKWKSLCSHMHISQAQLFLKLAKQEAEKQGWDWDRQLEKDLFE